MFATPEGEPVGAFFAPRVDVKDKRDHFEITAELPGVDKDDIRLTLVLKAPKLEEVAPKRRRITIN